MDNGKPIRETLAVDVPMAADHFRYFAGCILAEEGSANMLGNTTLSLNLKRTHRRGRPDRPMELPLPYGCPGSWLLCWQAAAAAYLTPSSTTSLSVLEFARLVQDVIPAGVFNVITGSGSRSGQYMLEHKALESWHLPVLPR